LHELAHQGAYAKADTVFNESFAVTGEEEGIGRWLAAQNHPALIEQFNTSQRYRAGLRKLIGRTPSDLEARYASPASVEATRARGSRQRDGGHDPVRPAGRRGAAWISSVAVRPLQMGSAAALMR